MKTVVFDLYWTVHSRQELELPESIDPSDKKAILHYIEETIHSMLLPTPDANERGTEFINEESVTVSPHRGSGEISREMIRNGIHKGIVLFEKDPNLDSGTVCRIGSCWFYFGGLTAEEETPDEYLSHVPEEDIVEELYETLKEIRKEDEAEYGQYFWFLLENLPKGETPAAEVG